MGFLTPKYPPGCQPPGKPGKSVRAGDWRKIGSKESPDPVIIPWTREDVDYWNGDGPAPTCLAVTRGKRCTNEPQANTTTCYKHRKYMP